MKKILLTVATLLTFFPSLTFASDVKVQITGMHCKACAKSLIKKFKKQKSINNISVEFSTQTFDITLNENADLPDEKIKKVIDWGGYELIEIKRP